MPSIWRMCSAPNPASIPAALADAAGAHAREIAVEHEGRRRSYERLAEDVSRMAQALMDLGVRPGHRVAVIAGLRTEALVAAHAAWRIGAVVVLHDPALTARELRRVFEDHAALVAVVDESARAAVASLPADLHPKAVIAVDPRRSSRARLREAAQMPLALGAAVSALRHRRRSHAGAPEDHVLSWRALMTTAPLRTDHPMPAGRDLALLQYTAGPDGQLLGAMLTHSNLVADAAQLRAFWARSQGARTDREAPRTHAGALGPGRIATTIGLHEPLGIAAALVVPLLGGQQLVLARSGRDVLAADRRAPITALLASPTVLTALGTLASSSELRRLRRILTPSGALDPVKARAWEQRLGRGVDVAYARAECGIALGGRFDAERPDAVGTPLLGVEVLTGSDAILQVAGPQVFHGYWNRPDETAHALTGDGWLRTGDTVQVEDGAMCVLTAQGAAVAPDGTLVWPREVARVLGGHPDVLDVDVWAQPAPGGGRRLYARLVLQPDARFDPEAMSDWAAERLAPMKLPAGYELVTEPAVASRR